MRDFGQVASAGGVVLLLSFVSAASYCHAQPAPEITRMTGERLVKLMGNVDPSTVHWTTDSPFPNRAIAAQYRDMVNGEFVHGYIQAVHDASEGREWCWSHSKPKPHILVEDAKRHLQQLPNARLGRTAAALIVEHWRQQFPCPPQFERSPK